MDKTSKFTFFRYIFEEIKKEHIIAPSAITINWFKISLKKKIRIKTKNKIKKKFKFFFKFRNVSLNTFI